MVERLRHIHDGAHTNETGKVEHINPFSYESTPEATVQLELENRYVPFSYRYFDGDAPTLLKLIPAYAPEFTLREYKLVIIIVGDFYGRLPGVLDQAALASVLLEQDGWKQVAWTQGDIQTLGVNALIERDLPNLQFPKILGPERPSPVGHPLTWNTRRQFLRGLALLKKIYTPKTVEAASGRSVGIRRKFIRRVTGDFGRLRPGSKQHLHGPD